MSPRLLAAGAALVAALVAAWFVVGSDARDTPQNLAFVDTAATDEVTTAVATLVPEVFSIDARSVRRTERLASEHLAGNAVGQYDELYGPFLAAARKQGASLTTRVRAVGVTWLKDGRAEVLVLADQIGSTPSGQTASGASQVSLRMERSGSEWKIAEIEVL